MKINRWSATAFLIFRPTRLKEIAHQYNDYINRPAVIEATLVADKQSPNYERSIDRIRKGLFCSFLLVLGSAVAAGAFGRVYIWLGGRASAFALETLQYIGIGILLWATLAKQGWSIQTMHGKTVPEVLDEFLYRILYVLGSFFLALPVTLQLA